MRIALIGYGKMGKIIEEIALERNHTIVARTNRTNPIDDVDFSDVDVAIEFTAPDLAVKHIEKCLQANVPIVVGTTAWNEDLPKVTDMVATYQGGLLHASNFSIGVNVFFAVNRQLARLLAPHPEYAVHVEETHHTQKLDAPSGTAVSIANDILFENDHLSSWVHQENFVGPTQEEQFGVSSYRKEGVPGTHIVRYASDIDTLEFSHTAHNRRGFALGAVVAAEWLHGKKGIYTMQDVLKF